VPTVALVIPGFFLGAYLLPMLIRWWHLVHTSFSVQEGDFLGPPKRRLLWFTPFALLLSPAPYLILMIIAVPILIVSGRIPAFWSWLLVGLGAYALLAGFLIIPRVARLRRMRDRNRKV
jgi:hypothetical protein